MRENIILACTKCNSRNYHVKKNKKLHTVRLETNKYCKFCKEHTMHKETK